MVTPRDRHLLLCDAPAVEGSLLSAFLRHAAVSLEDATVVSNSGSLAKDALPQGAFASAASVSEAAGQHRPALLRALIGALCPGGELVVQEAQVRALVLCTAHASVAVLFLSQAIEASLCCVARDSLFLGVYRRQEACQQCLARVLQQDSLSSVALSSVPFFKLVTYYACQRRDAACQN